MLFRSFAGSLLQAGDGCARARALAGPRLFRAPLPGPSSPIASLHVALSNSPRRCWILCKSRHPRHGGPEMAGRKWPIQKCRQIEALGRQRMKYRPCRHCPQNGTFKREAGMARFFSAANDLDGLIFAVCPRNRHSLRDARRSTDNWVEGWFRRVRKRRTSMHPIPGNIVGACVYPVRDRLPDV